jgi:hypothetical protein
MMFDYSLKFSDEAQATAVLFDGETPRYQNTDVIGTIYRDDGTQSDGYHVNVRTSEDAPELVPYQVFPVTPVRVWA